MRGKVGRDDCDAGCEHDSMAEPGSGDACIDRTEAVQEVAVIDVKRDRFPYAIVWTPIPCLTWFLPFVGHMVRVHPFALHCVHLSHTVLCALPIRAPRWCGWQGIADSAGAIHDFAGPYYIGYDDMAFGRPTRYLILDPKKITAPSKASAAQSWNAGVDFGDAVYVKRMHNLM